jgi:hypothetical protein
MLIHKVRLKKRLKRKIKEISLKISLKRNESFNEQTVRNILGGFRSRGVSLLSIVNKPSRLFESVHSLPSIKIVFRTAHSCNHLFTKIVEEQEFLKGLEHRRAIVIDGVNGYKYEIFTPDFDYLNFNTSSSKNFNI